MNYFTMPPPNELLNEQSLSLDEICFPPSSPNDKVKRRIVYSRTSTEMIPPVMWPGRLFTALCYDYEPLVRELYRVEFAGFGFGCKTKIAAKIKELFDKYMLSRAQYHEWWNRETMDINDAERINRMYKAPSLEQIKATRNCFEQALPIIAMWAMCDFSRRRENWLIVSDISKLEPIDIGSQPTLSEAGLPELSNGKGREKPIVAKPKSLPLSAAEKLEKRRLASLKREVAKLRKAGIIKQENLTMLDDKERWVTDYAD